MARADLLTRLVQAGLRSDKVTFRKAVEAVIAEERSKQHNVLADKLEDMLRSSPFEHSSPSNGGAVLDPRSSNLFHEILPRKQLADLILTPDVQKSNTELIYSVHIISSLAIDFF